MPGLLVIEGPGVFTLGPVGNCFVRAKKFMSPQQFKQQPKLTHEDTLVVSMVLRRVFEQSCRTKW